MKGETQDLNIREATAADHGEVLRLLASQLEEHALDHTRLETALQGLWEDNSRGSILLAFMAGVQEHAVGVLYLTWTWTLEHGGRVGWLEELYVEPHLRCDGRGTQLLKAGLELARTRGCLAIDLEVDTTHARAARLYLRHGFRPLARDRYTFALAPTEHG